MGTFPARFDSRCNGCDEWIDVGEAIGYVNNIVVCADCYDEDEEANRPWQAEQFALPEHEQ